MDSPFLSIIIPVYNAKEKLQAAIESIFCQVFTDYEIVIIDGLSVDGTLALIKDYSEKSQKIKFRSGSDLGIYDAMNKGIEMADGKWLYFLGSDDKLNEEYTLSNIYKYLNSTQAKVVYGNAEIVGNTTWSRNGEIYDGPFDFGKLLNKNICHQSIFYNTEFINTGIGKYNIDYKLCADWDLNLRCFAKSDFLFVDMVVAKFYGGGITTKSTEDEKFSKDFVPNIIKYFNLSIFNPVINSSHFHRFHEVLMLQKRKNYLLYMLNRLKIKFL